jgi:hypothetical protein
MRSHARVTRTSRQGSFSLAIALLVFVAAPALGAGTTAGQRRIAEASAQAEQRADDAVARLEAAHATLSSGHLGDAIRAAAGLIDVQVEAASSPVATFDIALPAELAAPVSSLLGAVLASGADARSAVSLSPREVVTLQDRFLADLERLHGSPTRGVILDGQRQLMRGVDRSALLSAALSLTEAIDAALPRLAAARSEAESAETVDGCDMQSVAPLLCVAGESNNVHDGAFALVIDMGGDDTYRGTSGASALTLPASVVIDLAGNDRYQAPAGATRSIGVGNAGLGVVVDRQGNDTYTTANEGLAAGGSTSAQGSGSAGVGMLADMQGNDTYTITATGPGGSVGGQGFGVAGAGILLDQGGDDAYRVDATGTLTETPNEVTPETYTVLVQAASGAGGVGLLSDSGGTDTILARAAEVPMDPADDRDVAPNSSVVTSIGYSLGGAASAVLLGPGSASVRAVAETAATRIGSNYPRSIGVGYTGAFGGVLDQGGDDTYRVDALSVGRAELVLTDECDCFGGEATSSGGLSESIGIGYGGAGVGAVVDQGGNDRYSSLGLNLSETVVTDERTKVPTRKPQAGERVTVRAIAISLAARSFSQGSAFAGGTGVLRDAGGNDVYESTARVDSTATARSTLAKAESFPHAIQGLVASQAGTEGAFVGFAVLQDLGGTDRYSSVVDHVTRSEPEAPFAEEEGYFQVASQAGIWPNNEGVASFLDRDGGTADVFVTSPATAPCQGTRGEGVWIDCNPAVTGHRAVGVGVNA